MSRKRIRSTAQSGGHARGVDTRHAAAEHDDPARQDAGHPAQQHTAAPEMLRQKISAHQDGHAPGDLAHRLEQRKAAIDLDRFVGQSGHAGFGQRFGQRFVGSQVQVGKEQLTGSQQRTLGRLRFLDFHNQVGLFKNLGVSVPQCRARLLEVGVRVTRARARAALDHHLVAALNELVGG